MTDFKSLCAELVEELENAMSVLHHERDISGRHNASAADAAIDRARAALAEPVPPPKCAEAEQTDSDLLRFLLDNFRSHSLHMDGTAYYVLDRGWPFNHRSSNSRAFVEQAYRKSCEHFRKQP